MMPVSRTQIRLRLRGTWHTASAEAVTVTMTRTVATCSTSHSGSGSGRAAAAVDGSSPAAGRPDTVAPDSRGRRGRPQPDSPSLTTSAGPARSLVLPQRRGHGTA